MFTVTLGQYTLLCSPDGLPDLYPEYVRHAQLAEEENTPTAEAGTCFVAVRRGGDWPFLMLAWRYGPASPGFYPGALLVPETGLLFLGAGEQLLAYQLDRPGRLWEDR